MFPSRVLLARNFFDVVRKLPDTGVQAKLQRKTWPPESFWTVTAVQPTVDGHHGKAWGIFTWKGKARNEQPTRVRGALKKVWRVYGDADSEVAWQRLATASSQNGSAAGEASASEIAQAA